MLYGIMSQNYIEKESFIHLLKKYSINLDNTTQESIFRSIFYINQALPRNSQNPDKDLTYIIETLTHSLTKTILEIETNNPEIKKNLDNFLIELGIPKTLIDNMRTIQVKNQKTPDIVLPITFLGRLENIIKSFIENILPSNKAREDNISTNQLQEVKTSTIDTNYIDEIDKKISTNIKSAVESKPQRSFVEKIIKERKSESSQTKNLMK